MGYLIDTNVLSEMRKGTRGNPQLIAWTTRVPQREMFLSVLVIGEVRHGIESVRRRDATQASALEEWLSRVSKAFDGRILDVTRDAAEIWGRLSTPDRLAEIDGLIAATALAYNLTLVTRNTRDVARTGVKLLNPFDAPSSES